ncbi:hypothetical protein XNC3_1650006 [Xenorhabdus nematophila F1]|nr:hypothetical protein XNC3_1650006 [Xenorhabdus nematophila F1]CEE90491.1 hypothetical protein XNA1_1550006 [Xenorhabdus nematophila str. Anatoliense]CEF28607.1 hypothetical protein XNW1_1210006 [Xenorhabdus nematophila str. Websteri]CEK24206.1 protein of unknown function [Xenorhabdus nematophila AN6/1]CEE93607.1 hypothetical protein XNA1_4070006 [Xenorhabdus nematophila str. Anatoliense]
MFFIHYLNELLALTLLIYREIIDSTPCLKYSSGDYQKNLFKFCLFDK